jgi:alkanesulfonate monooxygenase SsuD/methylene tetrahydromethanopterin reductase-like flavin-dependent oxidoreductase (luciferase family)
MDFGIFMQFERRDGASQAEAFQEGFALVDAAEAWGIDEAWLAEVHFAPARTVLSSPAVIASSVATRTDRLRVGTAVSVLPLGNPLRIAEEMATVDQIAQGRFDFGIGRSAFPRAYDVYGIPYEESRGRFEEALEIVLEAWKGDSFSYHGEFFQIENAHISPTPYTLPHPPLRVAATTEETFPRMGQQGMPIFVGLRGMDLNDLQVNLKEYRKAWQEAGHPGDGDVSLRIPVYAGDTEKAALEEPNDSIHAYFDRMSSLYRESAGSAGTEATELRQGRGDRLAELTFERMLETKVAFGSAEGLIERVTQLGEELGLKSIIAELNPGGLIPPDRVMRSMEILAKDVAPAFK